MFDDDHSDASSNSTLSMLSLHPSEDTINEPYPFPSVGVDLFEENILEDNFCSSNDQSHDNPLILETVDESFPSQELLFIEPKWDNHKCDSTQMVLIDSYEVYLEKTFEESHQVDINPFGITCERSDKPLELS